MQMLNTVKIGGGRNSNLELYRIIVMLLIVAHHYVVNSGLWSVMAQAPHAAESIFLYLFGMWGKTGINCFVLITGYFMCQSTITVKKFLKLLLEVEFYKIVIYFIFILTGYEPFSIKGFLKAILPITQIASNFTGCFLAFYLCIPFLNILVKNMNRQTHQYLLCLLLGIYTLLATFLPVSMNYVSWFCVLYFIASYIRLYGLFPAIKKSQWGLLALGAIALSILTVLIQLGLSSSRPYRWVSDSNALLAVVTSISLFMYFKEIEIKQSRFINWVGGSTFGVLLIHANSDTMRQWLWCDTLNNVGWYGSDHVYLHAIGSVLLVFAVCITLDRLRILYVEKPVFKIIDRYLLRYNFK